MDDMKRRLKFGRWGLAENPIGHYITWDVGDRTYLAEVTGVYRNEVLNCTFLRTKHFNGEDAPDVAASHVYVLAQAR